MQIRPYVCSGKHFWLNHHHEWSHKYQLSIISVSELLFMWSSLPHHVLILSPSVCVYLEPSIPSIVYIKINVDLRLNKDMTLLPGPEGNEGLILPLHRYLLYFVASIHNLLLLAIAILISFLPYFYQLCRLSEDTKRFALIRKSCGLEKKLHERRRH